MNSSRNITSRRSWKTLEQFFSSVTMDSPLKLQQKMEKASVEINSIDAESTGKVITVKCGLKISLACSQSQTHIDFWLSSNWLDNWALMSLVSGYNRMGQVRKMLLLSCCTQPFKVAANYFQLAMRTRKHPENHCGNRDKLRIDMSVLFKWSVTRQKIAILQQLYMLCHRDWVSSGARNVH